MNTVRHTIAIAACLMPLLASAQTYSVMDPSNTPPFPTIQAYARGVNDQGQVLVATNNSSAISYSICDSVSCTPLSPPVATPAWTANWIGSLGTVAGSIFQGTSYAYLGSSIIGYDRYGNQSGGFGLNSEAKAGNVQGLATGAAEFTGSTGQQAFRYLPTTVGMVSLFTLGGTNSEGRDINARGDIAGNSQMPGDASTHAFMDIAGVLTDLGTLGGQDSWANALNYHRTVVGCSTTRENGLKAFVKRYNRPMQGQPHLVRKPSCALAVNRINTAVGYSTIGGGSSRAVIWRNNQVTDLNTLLNATGVGWTLIEATGINTNGQIVGNGIHNGLVRPFLLY